MAAAPADIAHYTTDGVRLTSPTDPSVSNAIKATHPNAQDPGTNEIEMFYVSPADAQAMLDEAFAFLSLVSPPYLALEIDDTLGLGAAIPLTPNVPTGRVFDLVAGFDENLLLRSFSQQMATDRYAVEMIRGS
jgi:hypothetical protein